jgi:hypothetical protein
VLDMCWSALDVLDVEAPSNNHCVHIQLEVEGAHGDHTTLLNRSCCKPENPRMKRPASLNTSL